MEQNLEVMIVHLMNNFSAFPGTEGLLPFTKARHWTFF
jgi:hypothetical protein